MITMLLLIAVTTLFSLGERAEEQLIYAVNGTNVETYKIEIVYVRVDGVFLGGY